MTINLLLRYTGIGSTFLERFLPRMRIRGFIQPLPRMDNSTMDKTDAKILNVLQTDASQSSQEIADLIGIDENDCVNRIKKLEADKVILQRVALVDPRKVGANMTAFVAITTPEHSQEWLDQFHSVVSNLPEVVEFYRMSGQVDYLLRVVVPDIEAYDAFYKKLISSTKLKDVSSTFAIEQIKFTNNLPVTITE